MSRFRLTKNLLTAAAATGAGTAQSIQPQESNPQRTRDLDAVASVALTGAPTEAQVAVEGSFDGATWFVMAAFDAALITEFAVPNSPVKYVRGNVLTLVGGTAPTVTLTMDYDQ